MYCKECGAEIEDGKFCKECGTPLNSTKKKEGTEKKTKKLKNWESVALLILMPFALYWLSGLFLGAIGFLLAIIYILYNTPQMDTDKKVGIVIIVILVYILFGVSLYEMALAM